MLTSASASYRINSEADTAVNWTGNAADAEVILASLVYSDLSLGFNTFTVQVKNPNATADENTVNDVFVYTYEVSPVYYTNDVILNITTGDYGLEVTFALTDRIGTEVAVGTTLTCNKNIQATLSTITVDEYYTFSIFDAYGDSI